jgi:hypothetical protein
MASTVTSPVQLCNLALLQVAARAQVQSINPSDGTPAGDVCTQLYQPTVDAFARSAHWNCLRFQSGSLGSTQPPPLQLLKAAQGTAEAIANPALTPPPQPWLYEYALPPDCLKARFLVPQLTPSASSPPLTSAGGLMLPKRWGNTAIPFTVAVDVDAQGDELQVLLTDLCNAQLVYTRRLTNIGLWDSQFLMGAKSALAVWLAPGLNGSVTMANAAMGIAKAMLDAARMSDGNEGPQVQDHQPDWISVRDGGSYRPAGGTFTAPWDSFGFPGGLTY